MEHMTCEKARELFEPSLDGALSEKENRLLLTHLAHCETCRKEYSELEAVHALICESAVDVPEELHQRVMASIKKEPKAVWHRATWLRPLIAVSAAALLCVAVLHAPVLNMFKANSKADNVEMLPDQEYSTNLKDMIDDILNNTGAEAESPAEDKAEASSSAQNGHPDIEIKQIYTVADTDLLLMLINEKQAMLCRKSDDGAAEMLQDFTYKEADNVIVIEDGGKTQSLRIEGKTVRPLDDGELIQ